MLFKVAIYIAGFNKELHDVKDKVEVSSSDYIVKRNVSIGEIAVFLFFDEI